MTVASHDAVAATAERLVADATALYDRAGPFARRFARGKLSGDPLFGTLLASGAIPDASCLVDLGCGQALLAAWLHAARTAWLADPGPASWPSAWQAPPKIGTYLGIDQSRLDIARTKKLPFHVRTFRGDVTRLGMAVLDRCDVVTLFDVLQYLSPDAQEQLLVAVHEGLPPWGVVLMRVGDGGASLASTWSNTVDLLVCAARGHPRLRLHRRPTAEWVALLERLGFAVEILDDQRSAGPGKHFANVLIRASHREAATALR